MRSECGKVGVGGHGRELGAQVVPSARPTQKARARDGAEPGQAAAATIISATFVLFNVSLNLRVRGVYTVSVACRFVVRFVALNTVFFAFVPFQVSGLGGGTRTYSVRGRLRILGHPFRRGGKERFDYG